MKMKLRKYKNTIYIITIVILYLLISQIFLNKSFTYDDFLYSNFIEHTILFRMLSPHHLLYTSIHFIIYFIISHFENIKPLEVMQQVHIIAGLISIIFLYKTVRLLTKSSVKSILSSLTIVFTYGWWHYTQSGEGYTFGLLPLIIATYILLKNESNDGLKIKHQFYIGILWSISIFIHQMHLLFAVPLLIFIFIKIKNDKIKIKYLTTPTIAFFITSTTYIGIYLYVKTNFDDIPDFFLWITKFAHRGLWGGFSKQTLIASISGVVRSFSYMSPIKNFILVGNINWKTYLSVFSNFVLFILLFYLLILLIKNIKKSIKLLNYGGAFLLSWILVYSVFIIWWIPHYFEYWIFIIPPLIILLFSIIDINITRNLVVIIIFISLLFSTNFIFEVIPNSDLENIPDYQLAKFLNGVGADENDILFCREANCKNYYKYYFDKDTNVISFVMQKYFSTPSQNEVILKTIRTSIDKTIKSGGRIYFSDSFIITEKPLIDIYGIRDETISQRFIKPYKDELRVVSEYNCYNKKCKIHQLCYEN